MKLDSATKNMRKVKKHLFFYSEMKIKSLSSFREIKVVPPQSNQITVVAFQSVQLAQASFLQKKIKHCKMFF